MRPTDPHSKLSNCGVQPQKTSKPKTTNFTNTHNIEPKTSKGQIPPHLSQPYPESVPAVNANVSQKPKYKVTKICTPEIRPRKPKASVEKSPQLIAQNCSQVFLLIFQ